MDKKQKRDSGSSDAKRVIVSVIVASHRPDMIRDLCASLSNEDDTVPFEIIVAADYRTEPFQNIPDCEFIHIPDRSISRKRNEAVGRCRGEYLAFIDDDCRASKDWLIQGVSYLESHRDVAAVEGLTLIELAKDVVVPIKEYSRLEKRGFRTNNLFLRKETFEKAGGFDERFTVQREDLDLAFTLQEMGMCIDFSNSIRVEHRYRSREYWDFLKNCLNRRFDPLLFKKHPKKYRNVIGSPYPPVMLLCTALYIMILSALLAGNVPLVFGIVSVLIVCITWQSLRRIRSLKSPPMLLGDWVSLASGPFVLLGSLVYGSVKYRKLLIL